jgi:hypothetical protein
VKIRMNHTYCECPSRYSVKVIKCDEIEM